MGLVAKRKGRPSQLALAGAGTLGFDQRLIARFYRSDHAAFKADRDVSLNDLTLVWRETVPVRRHG